MTLADPPVNVNTVALCEKHHSHEAAVGTVIVPPFSRACSSDPVLLVVFTRLVLAMEQAA